MKIFLLFLWQLPQNLSGLLLIRLLKATKRIYKTDHGFIEWYFFERKDWFSGYISGASLGRYILLPYEDEITIKHEYGHCRQSIILGWFYLPIAGLPSVSNNLWDRYARKNRTRAEREKWYYSRYPENWADKLGGVKRWT